ncbi:MAG: nitroreductase family protein [candidate division Zixibacteria bacterium]|nr:nitroreductase family protein [candidate division Zixibacteria bacterium]
MNRKAGSSDSIFFRRHSKRSYLDKNIPDEALARVLEKVRWSPSCSNNQPWRLVLVRDPDRRAELMKALARGNQWAGRAPLLVVVCARREDDYVREDDPVEYHQFDCGLATMSLLLAAAEEGLMSHPMAGYSASDVKSCLGIAPASHVLCVVAVGYEGPPELLDDKTRAKDTAPRTRKALSDIVVWDSFDSR